ncbi:unnamed protein product [Porites evermanni]|uniref:Uncharacterized protein n=1 Tax=Porites evermanni TaxID=104178 RepID=A0ABN8SJI5_9CNID|nr:unnamed protein product [Porites evermanni]
MDECEKAGDACPFPLQCQEQENATFACGCDVGLKVVGEGDERTCQADDIYECRIQGDVCPPTLKCLKQEDGAYACRCEKKGFVVKGDDQERTCEANNCVKVKCNAHEMCHNGICRCKKGYRKSKVTKGKCIKALSFNGATSPLSSSVSIYASALVIGYLGRLAFIA